MDRLSRIGLLVVYAFVVVTALAGGLALVAGSVHPVWGTVLSPPESYLEGSPFSSYLVPGLLLIVLVAGVHAVAFAATLRRARWHLIAAAAGGFACVIWIFVQMVYIPFSFLQALYMAIGCLELAMILLNLGILDPLLRHYRSTYITVAERGARAPQR